MEYYGCRIVGWSNGLLRWRGEAEGRGCYPAVGGEE